jgi:transposase
MACDGRFTAGHAQLCRVHLDAYDLLTGQITTLDQLAGRAAEPFEAVIARLMTIPGIGRRIAQVIVAETGGDMTRFASSARLAAWAGLAPGDNESAGKRKKAAAPQGQPASESSDGRGAWASPGPPAAREHGSGDWPAGSAGSTSRRPPSLSRTPCSASPGPS